MAQFPKLKTGAVAQYPVSRSLRFSNETARFLDSSEQRYRDFKAGRRSWTVRLNLLDDTELTEVREFFVNRRGRFETFDFEDPWTETVVPNCRFAEDAFEAWCLGEVDNTAEVRIVETP
jgi:hypothetical protein